MNQKAIVITVIVIVVILVIKYVKKSRPEMIDYLNIQAGNLGGVWVAMEESDLKTAYRFTKLIKSSVKPDAELLAQFEVVRNKYKGKFPAIANLFE